MTTYKGIDYGLGQSNIDRETGIRFGVISQHSLNAEMIDEVISNGADYGRPTCPKCSNSDSVRDSGHDDIPESEHRLSKPEGGDWEYCGVDFACLTCKYTFYSQDAYSDEMQGWSYDSDGYVLTDCLQTDVFVIHSNYYTYAQFCSPCVPGAGNLDSPIIFEYQIPDTCTDEEIDAAFQQARAQFDKVYCLSHDWFDGGIAPYRVFKVADNTEVYPK